MRGRIFFAGSIFLLTACTAIIGTRDITYDANAEGGTGSSSGSSGTDGLAPPPPPPGSEAGPCDTTQLATDAKNCGRCGHDCLGGACTAGACQPVEVATALGGPTAVAVTADKLYISSISGKIYAASKDGKTQAQPIVTHQRSRGLFVEDPLVYWAVDDFTFVDGGTDYGGIYKCTIAACTPQLVTIADRPVYPRIVNNQIWFAAEGDGQIVKMNRDGTGRAIVTGAAQGVADFQVDGLYVYFTNSTNSLLRAQLSDGGATPIAPLNGDTWSFITQDKDNIYWTLGINNGPSGKTYGLPKANVTATPTSYGGANENKLPYGVGADDTNVYWVMAGTFTGTTNNKDGALFSCPKAGCPASGPTTLIANLYFPYQVVVDDAIYVVELGDAFGADGAVKKIAKP